MIDKTMAMMHIRYIKFPLVFFILFGLTSISKAQFIDKDAKIIRDTTEWINCASLRPVDLNKIMGINIAPHSGYWANSFGVPLKDGNIFDPRPFLEDKDSGKKKEMDTVFYFILTETNTGTDYCGIKPGEFFKLNLHLVAGACRTTGDENGLQPSYDFCFNDYTEKNTKKVVPSPYTMNDLLFKTLEEEKDILFFEGANIVGIFNDSLDNQSEPNWYLNVNQPNGSKDTLWVDIVLADGHKMPRTKVVVQVYKESTLTIKYDIEGNYPVKDLFANQLEIQEIDVTSKLKVYVPEDETQNFESYKYYLNQQYLNKYLANGDTISSSINVDALMFSGAEDIVAIVARTKDNCFVRAEDRVVIDIPLPNVFTPDGDGVNDILFGGEKFRNREFHLEVFNRWGNQIYSGEKGWDGTYRGEPVPPGVYQYVIILKRADGTPATVKGTVTLIRKGL